MNGTTKLTLRSAKLRSEDRKWEVEFWAQLRDSQSIKLEIDVPLIIDEDEYPVRHRTMAEATDMAHRLVLNDLLRLVILNAEWLAEQTKERITSAFPLVEQTKNSENELPKFDGDAPNPSE